MPIFFFSLLYWTELIAQGGNGSQVRTPGGSSAKRNGAEETTSGDWRKDGADCMR